MCNRVWLRPWSDMFLWRKNNILSDVTLFSLSAWLYVKYSNANDSIFPNPHEQFPMIFKHPYDKCHRIGFRLLACITIGSCWGDQKKKYFFESWTDRRWHPTPKQAILIDYVLLHDHEAATPTLSFPCPKRITNDKINNRTRSWQIQPFCATVVDFFMCCGISQVCKQLDSTKQTDLVLLQKDSPVEDNSDSKLPNRNIGTSIIWINLWNQEIHRQI